LINCHTCEAKTYNLNDNGILNGLPYPSHSLIVVKSHLHWFTSSPIIGKKSPCENVIII